MDGKLPTQFQLLSSRVDSKADLNGIPRITMAASGTDTVHYTADSVLRGVDALVGRDVDVHNSIQSMKAQLQDLAATLVDFDDLENVSCRLSSPDCAGRCPWGAPHAPHA